MWEINSSEQYLCFVYSICMGAILGLLYDFLKIDRIVFKRKNLSIFLQDVLFWIISAFMFFSFSVVFSNGQIRGYLLFGCLLGFLIFKLTISRIFTLIILPLKRIKNMAENKYLNLMKKINFTIISIINGAKNFIKKFLLTKKQKNIKNN